MIGTDWDVAERLAQLRDAIAEAAHQAGRRADEITLVGISKTQPAEAVVKAVQAGLRDIGENRIQEAALKLPRVREQLSASIVSELRTHMVGHLQSNKAGSAVELFDCIDSLDSLHLAQALSRRLAPGAQLAVRIEVYVGSDAQRPGLRPHELVDTVGQVLEVSGLRLEGLMTVAPLGEDARAAFSRVRRLKDTLAETFPRVHFGVLSMGMSEDFVLAILEGSTEVRLGSALFGPRTPRF